MDETTIYKVFYKENLDKIKGKYTIEEFIKADNKEKIANDLELNFKYMLRFEQPILLLTPIVENFISNYTEEVNEDDETIIYLIMCALAIVFGNPKETYRKLFSELRMRNIYGLLENLTEFIELIKNIFNYITSKTKNITYDITGMFGHIKLFEPFIISLYKILKVNKITLDSIYNTILQDEIMVLNSTEMGKSNITIKEIILKIFEDMNINTEDIKKELDQMESETNKDKNVVLSWTDWKKINDMEEVERIDEET